MKKALLILGLIFAYSLSVAQPAPVKVVLVGVVHQASRLIHTDSLTRILDTLKPDVLLIEVDTLSGFFKEGYVLLEPPQVYKAIRKQGFDRNLPPEIKAMYRYRRNNPHVVVLPFDMAIPKRISYAREHNETELLLLGALKSLSHYDLSHPHYRVQQRYLSLQRIYTNIENMGYYGINQPEVTSNIRKMMQTEATQLPTILDSLEGMEKLRVSLQKRHAAWDHRNKIMADNILRFVAQYPGKTIVVLTGVLHKYYLFDLLLPKQSEYGFMLHEYYNL